MTDISILIEKESILMKKLTNILATLLFAVTFSSIAQAGSINVGVSGSLVSIDAKGTEKDTDGSADTSTRTANVEHNNIPVGGLFLEYESDFYGLTLGFTHTPGSADVSKSAKSRNDVETSVTGDTTANTTARTFKAQAEVENFNSAYIELPIYQNFFVKAGLAEIDVNSLETASGNGGSYGNTSLDGEVYGAGFKGDIGDNMGFKVLYQATDFDTLSLTQTGNSVSGESNTVTADMDIKELLFALSYKF